MDLLVYSAYYEPEVASSLYLSTNLYEDFAGAGMRVRLFVPLPTRGVSDEVRRQYRKKKLERSVDGRLTIQRLWLPREKQSTLSRTMRYFLMHARFLLKSIRCPADAIFVQSTPPTQGAMAAMIKKIKHIPFVYNLQDIFPDTMVGMGLLSEASRIYRIGRKIENYTYRNADVIIVISNDMKANIVAKGVPEEKIVVVPNWVDTDQIKPVAKEDNPLFEEFGIDKNKFLVLYAGNFGEAQGTDIILRSAEILRDRPEIHFVLFGAGVRFEEACKAAAELPNVSIFPILPQERAHEVYSLGDVALITCKPGTGKSCMPSKTWSIMACNTPIIASFDTDSELADILNESNAGVCVPPGDAVELTEAILRAYKDDRKKTEKDSRAYVMSNASRERCTAKYVQAVKHCLRDQTA